MPAPTERDKDFPFVIGPLSAAIGATVGAGQAYTIPARGPRDADAPAIAPVVPTRAA